MSMCRVCNDTDTGIGNTGISLPTSIPIRGIANMTILKKGKILLCLQRLKPLTPYLEVTEHTKHFLKKLYICQCS